MSSRLRFALKALVLAGATVSAAAQLPQSPPQADNGARDALIASIDATAAQQTAQRRAKIAKLRTAAEASARQASVRATMLRLLGPLPAKTPLNARILGESTVDGIRIQKILFDSQPGFHVTALLYLPPAQPGQKLPAIVVAPGHGAAGKASDFGFATSFARNGMAVLSYDPIGQGERLQYPDPADPARSLAQRPTGEHAEASLQPLLIGEAVAKYFLWDGIRAVDYLQSRPDIDPSRIGAFGCSGGGAMTALLGALDTRIAATGTACYITSFDTLLPTLGPQDGEQTVPGWIAAGLDFPDWIELAAPRPYAIISTESDMFPFAGAQATEAEARRFLKLLGPDTDLAFIHGPGGHGNLRPIQADIVRFFLQHLAHSTAEPVPAPPPTPGASPFALPAGLPQGALQVTSTGQVSTAYPGAATVFSLNLAHARTLPVPHPRPSEMKAVVREALGPPIVRDPRGYGSAEAQVVGVSLHGATYTQHRFLQETGVNIPYELAVPAETRPGYPPKAAVLLLEPATREGPAHSSAAEPGSRVDQLASSGRIVMSLFMRPDPIGSEEQKTTLLGSLYQLDQRAELTGRNLLGMRVDDVLRALDELQRTCHVSSITAEASGHEALVLLFAAVLDSRFKHVTLHQLPPSYRDLLATPLPRNAPEDILPGVLPLFDTSDLLQTLRDKVSVDK